MKKKMLKKSNFQSLNEDQPILDTDSEDSGII
jgi:hypothetical protein